VAAVPEPAAGVLVATALAAGFLRSRRGRRGQGRPAWARIRRGCRHRRGRGKLVLV